MSTILATFLGDLGTLVAQSVFAFIMLLVAIWGQISLGNRALKMGQDIAFGFFAVFVWFIGMSQLISGRVGGLVLVIATILMGTALIDPIRRATWAKVLPIGPDDRMHMLGLVCLLFASAVFFLSSASVAAPIGTPTDRVYALDTAAKQWTVGNALPAPRKNLGLVAVGNALYAVGGEDATGPVGTVLVYTPGTGEGVGRWQEKAQLPVPRAHTAVAAVGSKIYVIGGDRDGTPVNTVSVYDSITDTWVDAPPLPAPRASASAATMGIAGAPSGTLFVVGGTAEDPNGTHPRATNTVYVLDTVAQPLRWVSFASLHTARMGAATTGDNGRIFVLGGKDAGRSLASAETLNPAATSWIPLPDMPEARANPAAAVIGANVYVVGGVSAAEATVATYVLDFAARRWSVGPDLPTGRSELGVAALGGTVYAVGGASDQLTQIVPTGGLLFAVGQAIIVGVLAVLLVGVGIRRVPRPQATPAMAGAGAGMAGGRRGGRDAAARRGVIASSLDDAGEKQQFGTRFRWRRDRAEILARLGLVAPTPLALLVGVVTAAIMVGVAVGGQLLTAALSPTIAANVSRIAAQAQANVGGFAAAAVAAVLVAVGEELLFRGAIQPRFGILLTALAFAALHTQYGFGAAPLTVLALGLVLGLARRFSSTTATLIAHVLFVVAMLALTATGFYGG